ncbi:hypothetical protein OF83DRAFT_926047 [Amylostereum chailletii]|nr:hypothetical protein OF83DRAFT_926047 [Amylostereum chailletii]
MTVAEGLASQMEGQDAGSPKVSLLDEEGAVSKELEACLKHIFAKYCTPTSEGKADSDSGFLQPPVDACLDSAGLDTWARATNGAPLSDEEKDDLLMLDVTEEGMLTFQGFLQLYQLQTENDEDETWKDLSRHGFDHRLKLQISET